jgi:hypothetical protein
MTIIIVLLVLILLCMFKTVRMFIGLLIILVWWNWPADKPDQINAEPQPTVVIEQSVQQPQPEQAPVLPPEPSPPRKARPFIQQ